MGIPGILRKHATKSWTEGNEQDQIEAFKDIETGSGADRKVSVDRSWTGLSDATLVDGMSASSTSFKERPRRAPRVLLYRSRPSKIWFRIKKRALIQIGRVEVFRYNRSLGRTLP